MGRVTENHVLGAQAARLPERRSRENSRACGARAGGPPALPVMAMPNAGPNTNGSQFSSCTSIIRCRQVTRFLAELLSQTDRNDRPLNDVKTLGIGSQLRRLFNTLAGRLIGLPKARAEAIRGLAQTVVDRQISFDSHQDADELRLYV
jgi:hypothetical protein